MQSKLRNLLILMATMLAVQTSSFGSAAPVEVASGPPDAKLLELAKHHFDEDIWPAEEKLFRAAENGEDADCSQGADVEADPAKAIGWKTGRIIRADRLKWLCTDPAASELVSPHGISIIGARIDSVLDLQWARVTYPLQMRRCAFTENLILERSHLRSLNLQATSVKDVAATGLNVDESVTMSDGFKAVGKVEIMDATIGGNFDCDAGQFIGAEGIALDAMSAKIGANVSLVGAHIEGEVNFNDATISGIFDGDGGEFINEKGAALGLDSVRIERNLFLRKANFQGEVWLFNANIGGNFECSGGIFTGSQDGALNAGSAKIGSNVSLGQSRFEGGVDFRGATIGGNLACDGGTFANKKGYALSFDSAKIDRNVFLRNHASFEGGVWLYNASVGGNFECSRSIFKGLEKRSALSAISAKIGSDVSLNDTTCEATADVAVTFREATIGGELNCSGSHFKNAEGRALEADSAEIAHGVSCTSYFDGKEEVRFHAEGGVVFNGATIGGNFACDGGTFANKKGYALSFDSAKIDRNVFLRNHASFEGGVWLYNTSVGGNFECSSATFTGLEKTSALSATSAKIGSDVSLREARFEGAVVEGAVVFNGATIGGSLACDGGTFANKKGYALSFDSAKIDRNVFLRNHASFEGGVWLYNASVGGNFECSSATFTGLEETSALSAISAKIGSDVYLNNGFTADGAVIFKNGRVGHFFFLEKIGRSDRFILDLQFAKVGILLNEEKSWPKEGDLSLNGFAYDEIDSRGSLNADIQTKWVRRQSQDQFLAQPYEQLAAVLRSMGREEEGIKVMIAKNEDHARHADAFWDWCWYNIFGKVIGYGYRPWNALGASLIVVGIGTVLFWRAFSNKIVVPTDQKAYEAHKDAHLPETYPRFNPFIYSLEKFVPLLKLGIAEYWIPNPNVGADVFHLAHKFALRLAFGKRGAEPSQGEFAILRSGGFLRCYLWVHIVLGWILTTLWVGGLTGLLKT